MLFGRSLFPKGCLRLWAFPVLLEAMLRNYHLLPVLIIVLTQACGQVPEKSYPLPKINGASLVNPPRPIDSTAMAHLHQVNANWVAVIPLAFSQPGEPSVYFDIEGQWWGERVEGTAALVQLAHQQGLHVMLKPQIWMREQWIGEFDLESEVEWQQWEADYLRYLMTFAQLADSLEVEMLCIGTELRTTVQKRPAFWAALCDSVRLVYNGPLTYAANWDDFRQVPFWSQLDYIGVDAYFPLVQTAKPSRDELMTAWRPILKELHSFSQSTGRPILFTEYGYQSADGAAGNHWEIDRATASANPELQATTYEALFRTFWGEPWVAGGFFWKWHFPSPRGWDRGRETDFTPQGKPAQEVIRQWYGRSASAQ